MSRLGCQKGFTLIELLVVIAILGVIAVVVVLNVGSFIGSGAMQAANVEAHQVQTAITAFMAESAYAGNVSGTVGPTSNIPAGEPATAGVQKYLVNPGQLQAVYTIVDGSITGAVTVADSRWGCSDCTPPTVWFCSGVWKIEAC